MKRSMLHRLGRTAAQLEAKPIDPNTLNAAFERFVKHGELPEHARLSAAVLARALQEPEARDQHRRGNEDYLERCQRVIREIQSMTETGREPDDVRRMLFEEACSTFDLVRNAARTVLPMLAQAGIDLTVPFPCNSEIDLPAYGSMGLYLLGWPEILVRPPYEAQATRVLLDHESLRQRIAASDTWTQRVAEGTGEFFRSGALPVDIELRDLVLWHAEFLSLHAILGGEQDDILLAVFDLVGTTKGEARERAIGQLQAVAREERAP